MKNFVRVRLGNEHGRRIELYFPSLDVAVEAIKQLQQNTFKADFRKIGENYHSIIKRNELEYGIEPAGSLITEEQAALMQQQAEEDLANQALSDQDPEAEF